MSREPSESPSPTGKLGSAGSIGQNNPYLQLADVLHELYWLACDAHPLTVDRVTRINIMTNPWDAAEQLARSDSLSRGIPFAAMDAALRVCSKSPEKP